MKELGLREKMYPASWKQLKKGAQDEKTAHAFLFCGPGFTGKDDMTLDLVAAFNDIDVESEREKILKNGFPDVVIVVPDEEKKKKEIGVDQVKDAIKKIGYYAYDQKYKVLIIFSADLMNRSAGNSLLKTLEEPPEKTIIILVANREERILTTIRSRCQRVYFGLKRNEEVRKYLEENERIDLPEGLLNQIVEISHGKYKLAEKLALNQDLLDEKKERIEKFRKALKGGISETFAFIEQETKNGKVNSEVIEDWLYFLHAFIKESISEGRPAQMVEKVFEMEKSLIEVKNKIENSNASPRTLLENYFVQLI
jgi:DNA polymerase III gamma/tau subunit